MKDLAVDRVLLSLAICFQFSEKEATHAVRDEPEIRQKCDNSRCDFFPIQSQFHVWLVMGGIFQGYFNISSRPNSKYNINPMQTESVDKAKSAKKSKTKKLHNKMRLSVLSVLTR